MVSTTLPRVVIAAPSTGSGKTTIATGLMAALSAAGLAVSGHKVGPDYIDPGYHGLASGRPGRNLDPHLVGEDRIAPLLGHGATTPARADIAVIEGVMGLFDGRMGTDGFSSTAHVAALTHSPVVVVVDVSRQSRTVGAIVHGLVTFADDVEVAGVVLNRVGSERNTREMRRAIARTGVPIVGELPADDDLATPSRHLGLVPVAERAVSAELIAALGEHVARHLDVAKIHAIAATATDLQCLPWDPAAQVSPVSNRPVIAVAAGRAFTFRYPEVDELLRAAGCEVVLFDPLRDLDLPPATAGIYLGGGFPEVYASELASNARLMSRVREAAASGVPVVAECAGLLYLARSLDGVPMAGVVPADSAMHDRLTLRYPVAHTTQATLLTRAGETVTGHEFHRTRTQPTAGPCPAWIVDGEPIGYATDSVHASYVHVHWAGHPQLAQRFAEAASHFAAGTYGP